MPKYFLGMRFGGLLLLLLTMSSSQVDAVMEEPTCAVESCGAECNDLAKCPMPGCLMPLAHYCTDCLSGTAMIEGANVNCCPNCSTQLKTPAKKKKPKPKKRKRAAGAGRQGGTSALSLLDSGLLAALKAKVEAEDWTLTAIEGWFSSPPMPRGCDVPYSGSCLVRQQIRAALSGDRVAPNTVGAMQFWLSDGLKEQPEPIIETPRVYILSIIHESRTGASTYDPKSGAPSSSARSAASARARRLRPIWSWRSECRPGGSSFLASCSSTSHACWAKWCMARGTAGLGVG